MSQVNQKKLLNYIHFNRHHNTMLVNQLRTEIESHHPPSRKTSSSPSLGSTPSSSPSHDHVILTRKNSAGNPTDYFDKTFAEYKEGFAANGKFCNKIHKIGIKMIIGESWLGLENLHRLTSQLDYKLKITMTDFDGKEYVAVYDQFKVTQMKVYLPDNPVLISADQELMIFIAAR